MHIRTDTHTHTYTYMYEYMYMYMRVYVCVFVFFCCVVPCHVVYRAWLGGWVWCGVVWCKWREGRRTNSLKSVLSCFVAKAERSMIEQKNG